MVDTTCRKILADAALRGHPTLVDIKRAIYLFEHRMSQARGQDHFLDQWTDFAAGIHILALKDYIFVRSEIIKTNLAPDSLPGARDGEFCILEFCING